MYFSDASMFSGKGAPQIKKRVEFSVGEDSEKFDIDNQLKENDAEKVTDSSGEVSSHLSKTVDAKLFLTSGDGSQNTADESNTNSLLINATLNETNAGINDTKNINDTTNINDNNGINVNADNNENLLTAENIYGTSCNEKQLGINRPNDFSAMSSDDQNKSFCIDTIINDPKTVAELSSSFLKNTDGAEEANLLRCNDGNNTAHLTSGENYDDKLASLKTQEELLNYSAQNKNDNEENLADIHVENRVENSAENLEPETKQNNNDKIFTDFDYQNKDSIENDKNIDPSKIKNAEDSFELQNQTENSNANLISDANSSSLKPKSHYSKWIFFDSENDKGTQTEDWLIKFSRALAVGLSPNDPECSDKNKMPLSHVERNALLTKFGIAKRERRASKASLQESEDVSGSDTVGLHNYEQTEPNRNVLDNDEVGSTSDNSSEAQFKSIYKTNKTVSDGLDNNTSNEIYFNQNGDNVAQVNIKPEGDRGELQNNIFNAGANGLMVSDKNFPNTSTPEHSPLANDNETRFSDTAPISGVNTADTMSLAGGDIDDYVFSPRSNLSTRLNGAVVQISNKINQSDNIQSDDIVSNNRNVACTNLGLTDLSVDNNMNYNQVDIINNEIKGIHPNLEKYATVKNGISNSIKGQVTNNKEAGQICNSHDKSNLSNEDGSLSAYFLAAKQNKLHDRKNTISETDGTLAQSSAEYNETKKNIDLNETVKSSDDHHALLKKMRPKAENNPETTKLESILTNLSKFKVDCDMNTDSTDAPELQALANSRKAHFLRMIVSHGYDKILPASRSRFRPGKAGLRYRPGGGVGTESADYLPPLLPKHKKDKSCQTPAYLDRLPRPRSAQPKRSPIVVQMPERPSTAPLTKRNLRRKEHERLLELYKMFGIERSLRSNSVETTATSVIGMASKRPPRAVKPIPTKKCQNEIQELVRIFESKRLATKEMFYARQLKLKNSYATKKASDKLLVRRLVTDYNSNSIYNQHNEIEFENVTDFQTTLFGRLLSIINKINYVYDT